MSGQLPDGTFAPGNQLHANRKPRHVYDTIMREVVQNPAKLKQAVSEVLNQASNGDLAALDWIACRLEGKPAQAVTVSGDEDKPLITMIKFVVVTADQEKVIEHGGSVIDAQPSDCIPSVAVSNNDTHLT